MKLLKRLLVNIFGPKSDPWTHARALRIGKKILKGIFTLNIALFVLAVKYGGDATFALCGWFIVANLMIAMIIKFKDYNFIAEVIINGNDICFELPEEVIVVSKDDIKELLEQCKMSQEDILLYDEGKGKTTVETHADFYISENAFSITYVEGTCRYYVSIGLEILKKEGVINMAYFS